MGRWKIADSEELYQVGAWGSPYFAIGPGGCLMVRPDGAGGPACDLYDLVTRLRRRGISAPILFRFDGIIRSQIRSIQTAFGAAIEEAAYGGRYHLAYPIKVNQQYHVVETVRQAGVTGPLALEVGSKPELLAVMAIHDKPDALLICNGYKDSEYISLAMLARKLGRRPIVVIEQLDEVDLVLQLHEVLGTEIELGIRMKPTSKGAGRWDESAGDKAKFGLSAHGIIRVAERLIAEGKDDWLKLLHFHVGSQITSIGAVTRVMREASRVYTELARLCPSLCFFNAGGGLGIDYDGSKSSFHSSVNYTVAEYAAEIIYNLKDACEEVGIGHPDVLTESGRATVAHHAVLVVEATDRLQSLGEPPDLDHPPSDHEMLGQLAALYRDLTLKNCRETLHETLVLRDDLLEQFIRGDVTLAERAYAERLLRNIVRRLVSLASQLKRPLEELSRLEPELDDIYFCNFSVFQSMPDSWAIDQLFPLMPIHRLDEEPKHHAVLADLTCDSDGKVDRFIDARGAGRTIRLHDLDPRHAYYLGVFLIGAYQEILGDLHNLFGDTNAVHVDLDEEGQPIFSGIVEGDTMREVLQYVQFNERELFQRLRDASDRAMRAGNLSEEEARELERRYREALGGYTYLVKDDDAYSKGAEAPARSVGAGQD